MNLSIDDIMATLNFETPVATLGQMLVQQEANGVRVFHVDNRKCWLYFWKAVFRIEVPKLGSIDCCIFSPFFILAQGPQFDAETAAMFVNTDELDAMVVVTNTTGSSRASSIPRP